MPSPRQSAILRYRLFDIEILINRTLIYGMLTSIVIGAYVLVVGGLGTLFQTSGSLWISLFATGLVALAFQPLRLRLQRAVNRLMYGDRDDPYRVLSSLGQRLQGTVAPDAVLTVLVETIAQVLKLPYVAISLRHGENLRLAAEYGLRPASQGARPPEAADIRIPLVYQAEPIGELVLVPHPDGPAFASKDKRLLQDIALQAGVAAHAVRLTQELQHSREQLVRSREEERRRLRRDLHDELGPQLASLKLNLSVARKLVRHDPDAAEALLVDLRVLTQDTITDIRRLVYDLRPPALDELGLVSAIQEYARQIENQDNLCIRLDGPYELPGLSAAVEVAAYRITLEALTNVVRHSQGSNASVSIAVIDRTLQVEVCDDGAGLGNVRPGVGMNSMRERAAELGGTCVIETLPQGGTRVLAKLPLA